MMSGSSVAEFYRDRSILITGATGFMGKVLVEKLLRSCPSVKKVYLLMRPKGRFSIPERLEELLKSKVFENIRGKSDVLRKVVAVQGDIMLPELGLSETDTDLLVSEVSIVFHAAATIKFDEAIKISLEMNVLGTKRMAELCHKMRKLVALVHVSTAYCNCDRREVQEIVYPPPVDPYKLLQLIDWMDEDTFNYLTPKLLGDRPNTYTFTKSLAEHVLLKEASDLPYVIVRPSIVAAAWKEPLPGWVDNMNGPTGIFVGSGKGLLRTMHCQKDLVADIIPVDIPINLMIVCAWYIATTQRDHSQLKVFNCATGIENPITWKEVRILGMKSLTSLTVLKDVVWYPHLSFPENRTLNTAYTLAFQWIPAYIMDAFSRLVGKRPIMTKIAKKMDKATACLEYFTTHEWRFFNDNMHTLWGGLSVPDQRTFNFEVSSLSWPAYMDDYCRGCKTYVLKEDVAEMANDRKHLHRLWFLQQISRILFVLFVWRIVMLRSESAQRMWYSLLRMLIRMLTYLPGLNRI